jgi:outer membrane receptor for ferrienterochelin and colicins
MDNKYPENTITINGTILGEEQNVGLSIFGMKNDRHEFDANGDGFTEIGRMNVLTFGSKLFYKLNPRAKITSEFNAINHKIRGGNKLSLPAHETDVTEFAEHKTLMGQVSYEQYIGFANKLNVYASFQNTDRNSYYGANMDLNAYGRTDNQTVATGANYSHFFDDFIGAHNLIFGYEFNSDEMNDQAPKYNRNIEQRTNAHGIYLQDDWMLMKELNFLLGARMDKHNLIEDLIINPRASMLYKPYENISLRGTFSTGYRAPQAFDEDLHITQVGGEGVVILVGEGLKPEFSKSVSVSADYSFKILSLPLAFSLEYFNTTLEDAFSLVDKGSDSNGNRLLVRENSESANVSGITCELQSNYQDFYSLKLGLTMQKSVFSEEIEWSSGDIANGIAPQYSSQIFKTPDNYGYFLLNIHPYKNLNFDLSGYFTGKMYVPHYAGYIPSDELKETESFFDLNAKVTYMIASNPNIELSLGVQNILNSYQKDFDKYINRDGGYIYGPFRPMSTYFKIRFYY